MRVTAGVGVSLEALHFGEARDGTVFGEAQIVVNYQIFQPSFVSSLLQGLALC